MSRSKATAMPTAALLVAALLLAGCGASDGGGGEGAGGVASSANSASPSAAKAPNTRTSATAGSAARSPAGSPSAATPQSAATGQPAPPATAGPSAAPVAKPPIMWDPIPFGPARKAQMVAYARRHYGLDTYRLIDPHVIVIHYTETPDYQSTFNTFAPDTPDPELHELPNTCAHFVIDSEGTIHQLVPLGIMCRHTVGLNWTAIGIEHVGSSDWQVLDDRRQMQASLTLVRWLRCRFHIPVADVIGHNESLASPFHHEDVPSLRTQTHSDFNRADMQIYRRRLRALGGCPPA